VGFSTNASNTAKNTTATFGRAGLYTFQVSIVDPGGLSTTSTVAVTVNQTLTQIVVTPGGVNLNENQSQQFVGAGLDQFGQTMSSPLTFTWSKASGVGTIDANGLYAAGGSAGSASIVASNGGINGSASVSVIDAAPSVATAASPSSNHVSGSTSNLSVV